jgi:hypothetical protein
MNVKQDGGFVEPFVKGARSRIGKGADAGGAPRPAVGRRPVAGIAFVSQRYGPAHGRVGKRMAGAVLTDADVRVQVRV